MSNFKKLGIQLLLLPVALLASDSRVPSSSTKGTDLENEVGDAMSAASKHRLQMAYERKLAELEAKQRATTRQDEPDGAEAVESGPIDPVR